MNTLVNNVSKQQLFVFLANGGLDTENYEQFSEGWLDDDPNPITPELYEALKQADLKPILNGSEMSEDHLGGDDLVAVADDVLAAIKEGYEIVTWYGPKSEALVAGIKDRVVGRARHELKVN